MRQLHTFDKSSGLVGMSFFSHDEGEVFEAGGPQAGPNLPVVLHLPQESADRGRPRVRQPLRIPRAPAVSPSRVRSGAGAGPQNEARAATEDIAAEAQPLIPPAAGRNSVHLHLNLAGGQARGYGPLPDRPLTPPGGQLRGFGPLPDRPATPPGPPRPEPMPQAPVPAPVLPAQDERLLDRSRLIKV